MKLGCLTLFTIGYEKARLADVVAALAAAGVATLIDVRDRPISRRPGFSKRQLAAAVEAAGIRYLHLQALGTPPEGREASRRREWPRFWDIVERKLGAAPKPNWRCSKRPRSRRRRRAASYATRPIGSAATAAGSPRSSPSGTAFAVHHLSAARD